MYYAEHRNLGFNPLPILASVIGVGTSLWAGKKAEKEAKKQREKEIKAAKEAAFAQARAQASAAAQVQQQASVEAIQARNTKVMYGLLTVGGVALAVGGLFLVGAFKKRKR